MGIKIGIDPDVDKSGVCIIEDKKIIFLGCCSFFDLIDVLYDHHHAVIYIEAGWLNKTSNYHVTNGNVRIAANIGSKVGSNATIGKLLEQYCIKHQIVYRLIKPTGHKWKADFFRKVTGWDGRTNEEMRDAVRACWG